MAGEERNAEQMHSPEYTAQVMDVAMDAGRLLLENGAEIFRVEDTMQRIAGAFGVSPVEVYVMTNGIFTSVPQSGGVPGTRVRSVPVHGARLDKVIEVNRLSRRIARESLRLDAVSAELDRIRNLPEKKLSVQLAAAFLGGFSFEYIFTGTWLDCLGAALAAVLLWLFVYRVYPKRSKIVANLLGGAVAGLACILMYTLGIGTHLETMFIGCTIVLVPGVPFTNGIRDIAGQNYLSGTIRLLDALLVFAGVAIGVGITYMAYVGLMGSLTGGVL